MKYQFSQAKFAEILLFCAALGVFFSAFVSTTQAQTQAPDPPTPTTTFAQTIQKSSGKDYVFTNNAITADFNTVAGGSPIDFKYLDIMDLDPSLEGFQNAHLFITTTTTATATSNMNMIVQPLNSEITISIVRDTPAPLGIGLGTRENLLTAVISMGMGGAVPTLTGTDGGNSASLNWTTPDHTVIYTSDFLDFSKTEQHNLGFSFSSVFPALSLGGNFLQSFTAAGTGTFASDLPPVAIPGTTAAAVTISGRVLSPLGRGLKGARVNIIEADGTTRTVLTNPSGYFRFLNVSAGQSAILSVFSKRYIYTPQVVTINNDLDDLNFTP